MLTIIELRRKAAECLKDATALTDLAAKEKRDLTDEEVKQIDDLMAESDKHRARFEQLEKLEQRNGMFVDADDVPEERATVARPAITEMEPEGFRDIGTMCIAVAKLKRSDGRDTDNRLIECRAATGANTTIDSEGGFLVGEEISPTLVKRAWDTGKLEKLCWKVPVGGDHNRFTMHTVKENSRANGSRWGGLRVYRTAEAGTYTSSTAKLREFSLKVEKMTGLCYATDEMMADAAQMAAVMTKGFGDEFGFKKDDEIINGLGTGQMLGILASDAKVSVAKETGQSAKTITAKNIMKMRSRFSGDMTKAVWLANVDTFEQLSSLSVAIGTAGQLLWVPANGLAGRELDTLYGVPVMFIEQAATLGTVGDIMLADFSEYVIAEKGGVEHASSIHVNFTTGEQAFRFTMRNNGAPLYDSPLTPYKGASTLSTFVSLATRA